MYDLTKISKLIEKTKFKNSPEKHSRLFDLYNNRIPEKERFTFEESVVFSAETRKTLKDIGVGDPAFKHYFQIAFQLDNWRLHLFYSDITKYITTPTLEIKDPRGTWMKSHDDHKIETVELAKIIDISVISRDRAKHHTVVTLGEAFNQDEFLEWCVELDVTYTLVPYENYVHLDKTNQG